MKTINELTAKSVFGQFFIYLYCGKAHAKTRNVMPIEPEKAKPISL